MGSPAPRTAFGVRLQELCTSHGTADDVLSTASAGSQPPSPHAGQVPKVRSVVRTLRPGSWSYTAAASLKKAPDAAATCGRCRAQLAQW